MRRDGLFALYGVLLTFSLVLFACGGSGSNPKPAADGDDVEDETSDGEKLGLGEPCTRNLDCRFLCPNFPNGKVCSRTCVRDEDCNTEWKGSTCFTFGNTNLCVLAQDETEGDGDLDVDVVCQEQGTGSARCNGKVYQTCIHNKWVDSATCGLINPFEQCSVEAQGCIFVPPDGDEEIEVGACSSEGKHPPTAKTISAEEFFSVQAPNLSKPLAMAKICTSENKSRENFPDGTYVCLDIPSADPSYIGSELAFTFLAAGEGNYPYFIKLDLVCGKDKWGTFSLFMDDVPAAVPLYSSTETITKVNEMCDPAKFSGGLFYDEYKLPQVLFGPVCLVKGYHSLKMRVVEGDDPNSKGFKLGLDYVSIFGNNQTTR